MEGTTASLPTYGDTSVATVDYEFSRAFGGGGRPLVTQSMIEARNPSQPLGLESNLEPQGVNAMLKDEGLPPPFGEGSWNLIQAWGLESLGFGVQSQA